MLLQAPGQTSLAPPLVIEAVGQRCRQTNQFSHLGGVIHGSADLSFEIERRIRLMWACFKRFGPEMYDRTTVPLSVKVGMQKAEIMETLLYGCVTWTFEARNSSL